MLRSHIRYFILTILTIIIGLLSRHYSFFALFIGDILWALMVYYIMRFLFVSKGYKNAVIYSLIFCYAIEFSQLYKAPWIDSLRHTLFGRLVLGDTFLWGDLLSYTVGIVIGILIDRLLWSIKWVSS
jgi:hypothetical protein